MILEPSADPQLLDDIVSSLVARFHPECIYLFGSRARGDNGPDSDYDFYMEVSQENWPNEESHTRDGFLVGFRHGDVHCRVPGWLAKNKDDSSRIMFDVAREGVLLYGAPGFKEPVPSPQPHVVRQLPTRIARRTAKWRHLAEVHYDLMNYLAGDLARWKEPICFHAQQSAEKFLKAVISQKEKPLPIHDLKVLFQHARNLGFVLGGITRHCKKLSEYASRGRYPYEVDAAFREYRGITQEETLVAMERAHVIRRTTELELA